MAYDASVKYTFLMVAANGVKSKVGVIVQMLERNKKPQLLIGSRKFVYLRSFLDSVNNL